MTARVQIVATLHLIYILVDLVTQGALSCRNFYSHVMGCLLANIWVQFFSANGPINALNLLLYMVRNNLLAIADRPFTLVNGREFTPSFIKDSDSGFIAIL